MTQLTPDLLQEIYDMTSVERRVLIAHAIGLEAHLNGDGGRLIAKALRNIADRLEGRPRRDAA